MRLWCFDDAHHWASSLKEAGEAKGHTVRLFDDFKQPDNGHVFIHMHNHPSVRHHHRRLVQHFATNPLLHVVPGYREAMLYDNKIDQLCNFVQYMPPTKVLRTPSVAREYLDSMPPLPMISKSSEGGGVRMLRTYDDCKREIKLAFSDLGIKSKYGSRAHGYLYWQQYLGDPEHVIRVACIGSNTIMLKRGRRIEMSRRIKPVVEQDDETFSAGQFAREFFHTHGFKFGAVDLLRSGDTWYLIKFTTTWSLISFAESRFADGRSGAEMPAVIIDEMVAGTL